MLAVKLVFNWKDAKNKASKTILHIPTGFSIAQMIEAGQAAAQILANVSVCELTSVSASVGIDLSGATIRAVANSVADIGEKLLLLARSTVSGLKARFNIPTFDENFLVAGSDALDFADADVAALVSAIEDGLVVGGTPVLPRDKRGNDLVLVSQGREIFRG